MSAITRRPSPGYGGQVAVLLLVLSGAGALALPSVAARLAGAREFVNPVLWVLEGAPWSGHHTAALLLLITPLLLLLGGYVAARIVLGRRRRPIDTAASLLAHGRGLERLRPPRVRQTHKRLGLNPTKYPGVQLGYTVAGNTPLRATYEDTLVMIAGPRRGKTRTVVVPNVLLSPGACVSTSVKPDVLEATVTERAALGRVWVFDPQGLASAHQKHRAWWNPLTQIRTLEDADRLAKVFSVATFGENDGKDQFFPTEGRALLGGCIFAAAVSGKTLPDVAQWLRDDEDDTPVQVLKEDHPAVAAEIAAKMQMVRETRSGVYAHARGSVGFLASSEMRSWVTPRAGQPAFDPEVFAAAPSDTAYLISEESGGAGPLIAALTEAITQAAERAAAKTATGRRETPMLVLLDEAANICRLPDLPSKYSTWGSRGIIPLTILQSEEQGEKVWGRDGFAALWNAATVQVFAGGNASDKFLSNLSKRIGDYEYTETSSGYQQGQRTSSSSRRREPILDVADLAALDLDRMIVLPSSMRPVLTRMMPASKDRRLKKYLRRRAAQQKKVSTNV